MNIHDNLSHCVIVLNLLTNDDATLPRSHIHGSSCRIHYGLKLTDDPGIVDIRGPLRMHNGLATGFDGSTKDNTG